MKTFDAQSSARETSAIQKETLTVRPTGGLVATDSLAVTAVFAAHANTADHAGFVEDDSTDIYTLERCSPLNDF